MPFNPADHLERRDHESVTEFTVRRMKTEFLYNVVVKIEARIAEHDNPYDEGEEQYVAGLRDALSIINAAY